MRSKIALFSLVIVLGIVNWSIAGKEKHLAEGGVVYLALAPLDPRSLMQGDYMALRFHLATEVSVALRKAKGGNGSRRKADARDGSVVVNLDERNIGSFKNFYKDQTLSKNEILMRYRVRNGAVKLGTNAFFFQEGKGHQYQPARFGQFRVDDGGELLLVAMYDENLNRLGPVEKE